MRTIPGKPGRLDKKSKAMQRIYKLISRVPFLPSAGRYKLTISHARKFIWFRVPKAGSSTILTHLRESEVFLDMERAGRIHYPVKLYEDYFKFAFVRNPWSRLVSCWKNKVVDSNVEFNFDPAELERMQHFEAFVDFAASLDIETCNSHLRTQTALIDLNNIDYLGRMESFDDDVNHIFRELGLKEKAVVPRNVSSSSKPYQDYYSQELAAKVAQIYRKDIRMFGYRF